jgi:hypothetical protein
MSFPTCFVLRAAVALALLAGTNLSAAAQGQPRPKGSPPPVAKPRAGTARQPEVSLTDPQATATIIAILARHAENPAKKTDLDRRLDRAMKRIPESRKIAAEMVQKYRSLPLAQRQRLFGSRAALSAEAVAPDRAVDAVRRISAKREAGPALLRKEPTEPPLDLNRLGPKHRESEPGDDETPRRGGKPRSGRPRAGSARLDGSPLPEGSRVRLVTFLKPDQLEYTGLRCREETDWDQGTASDEYYIITAVVSTTVIGDETVPIVTTVKHPSDRNYYTGVDTGDRKNGPIATCWDGAAANIVLIVTVLEQDSGDNRSPERYRRWINILVLLTRFLQDLPGGESVVTAAPAVIRDFINPIEDLPETDDYIQARAVALSSGEVSDFADAEEQMSGPTPYDFITDHNGDGARIRIYFRITP